MSSHSVLIYLEKGEWSVFDWHMCLINSEQLEPRFL